MGSFLSDSHSTCIAASDDVKGTEPTTMSYQEGLKVYFVQLDMNETVS